MRSPLIIDGMYGLGDCIHQRAAVVQWLDMELNRDVYLRTPWPCLYWDLERLKLLEPNPAKLHTQMANMRREQERYTRPPVTVAERRRVWYNTSFVKQWGFLGAMLMHCGFPTTGDFRLPVHPSWYDGVVKSIYYAADGKPILVLRVLTERNEWAQSHHRNPDFGAFASLYAVIRELFFVVSVAYLSPNREWLVGERLDADLELHGGQLSTGELLALFETASCVYTPAGFGSIMANAVGTPSICVYGAHENSSHYVRGMRFAPFLGIDPIRPCGCFHVCSCSKRIDVAASVRRVRDFAIAATADQRASRADRHDRTADAVHEPGRTGSDGRSRVAANTGAHDG